MHAAAIALLACSMPPVATGAPPSWAPPEGWTIQLSDTHRIPTDWSRDDNASWPLHEISGIAALPFGWFVLVSDDRGTHAESGEYHPPRFGFIQIGFAVDDEGHDTIRSETPARVEQFPFTREDGSVFPQDILDTEGVAVLSHENRSRQYLIASEGRIKNSEPAALYRFDQVGGARKLDLLPDAFDLSDSSGPRHNRGFESLCVTPDSATAFAATELPLTQDGDRIRILQIDVATETLTRQIPYTVGAPGLDASRLENLSLKELIALDDRRLLALESAYTPHEQGGPEHESEYGGWLYLVELPEPSATDEETGIAVLAPAVKAPLASLRDLGAPNANYEGMCLGPDRPGEPHGRILLIVSDNGHMLEGNAPEGDPGRDTTLLLMRITGDLPVQPMRDRRHGR